MNPYFFDVCSSCVHLQFIRLHGTLASCCAHTWEGFKRIRGAGGVGGESGVDGHGCIRKGLIKIGASVSWRYEIKLHQKLL